MTNDEKPEKKKKRKPQRRGQGEGSIIQQPNGTWLAAITVGTDANGKRIRKYVRGKTKEEINQKLTQLQIQKLEGGLVSSGKLTVGDLLVKWLDTAMTEICPSTHARYKGLVDKHIVPIIGKIKLSSLKPLHVQSMLSTMQKNNCGAETRRYAYQVIRRAFNVAIRWELLSTNPCGRIDVPKVTRRDIAPLTVKQAKKLLVVTKDEVNGAIFPLAITTGLRRGEILALRWDDIDLKKGTLSVRRSLEEIKRQFRLKEPKSKSGIRVVNLSAIAIEALRAHKAKRMAAGLASNEFVFTDASGVFLRKRTFDLYLWQRCRKAAEIPDTVCFHDLRHTAASILLQMGTHPKVVQAQLGHSKISLTLDRYSHLMPGMQEQAAKHMDTVLGSKTA